MEEGQILRFVSQFYSFPLMIDGVFEEQSIPRRKNLRLPPIRFKSWRPLHYITYCNLSMSHLRKVILAFASQLNSLSLMVHGVFEEESTPKRHNIQ